MQRCRLVAIVRAAIVAAAAIVFLADAAEAKRIALVISNSAYKNVAALDNPGNDASDVGAAFERLGLEVLTVEDGSFDAMRRGLLDFAPHARFGDRDRVLRRTRHGGGR